MVWYKINVDHEDDHRSMMSEKYLERCGPRVHLVQVHSTPTQWPKSSWFGPGVSKFHPKGRATGHHKSHSHTHRQKRHTLCSLRSLSLLVFRSFLQFAVCVFCTWNAGGRPSQVSSMESSTKITQQFELMLQPLLLLALHAPFDNALQRMKQFQKL